MDAELHVLNRQRRLVYTVRTPTSCFWIPDSLEQDPPLKRESPSSVDRVAVPSTRWFLGLSQETTVYRG